MTQFTEQVEMKGFYRYLKKGKGGNKVNALVFEEVEDAIGMELAMLRKRVRVPKERGMMRPTVIDLINHYVIGLLCVPPELREAIRAIGQAELERRQRSVEPIPFEPGGTPEGIALDRPRPLPGGSSLPERGNHRRPGKDREGRANNRASK